MRLDHQDRPVEAGCEWEAVSLVRRSAGARVGRASGAGWDDVSNSAGTSLAPAPAGLPFVAWQDDTCGSRQIYLRHLDGSAWQELGGSASGGGISRNSPDVGTPELVIGSSGRPVVT